MNEDTPPRGLLVEDDEAVRALVVHGLSPTRIDLCAASGIAEAWRHLEGEDFAFVILDLVLPDGDGRRFLSELRAWSRTARVPVLVLSAKASRSVQLDCLRLGADDYFDKPFDPGALREAVLREVERARVVPGGGLDPVTRLLDRSALATRFREVTAFAHARSQPATVAYLELESVTETSPDRTASDATLPEAARVLRRTLRNTDAYGRWDDRSLVLILPATRIDSARQVVERLLREIRNDGLASPSARGTSEGAPDGGERVRVSAAVGDALKWTTLDEAGVALGRVLERAAGHGSGQRVVDEDPLDAELARVRVLLVDGDPGVATLVRYPLEGEGIELRHVADGDEALALFRDEGALAEVDLVVLDVKIRGTGGYQLLEVLRKDSPTRWLPVIMLTQMGREAEVVRAFELGADDYLPKPFSPVELLARIRRLVRSPGAGDARVAPATSA